MLADLRTGAITAEIELSGARMSKRLNTAGSMSGSWNISSAKTGEDPYTLTTPARTMGVALRDGRPMWGGILWTRRRDSTSDNVDLGFADWWSYFDHRFVLPTFVPDGTTAQVSTFATVYTQIEQNEIARQLVAQAQAAAGGDLGIVYDATYSDRLRDRVWAGHELVDVGTALKNLSDVIDGPDLMFDVGPELDELGRVVKLLRIGNPKLGQQGSPHVFEAGGNIIRYSWDSDGTRMTTRAFATGEGIEAGQLIAVTEDDTRYADGWPLLESDANYNTVSVDTTLHEHAAADLYRARLPVVTPSLVVDGSGLNSRGRKVGPSIGDVSPGDEVRVVIRDRFFGGDGISTSMRIVAIDFDPGESSTETMTLTMNPVLDDVS